MEAPVPIGVQRAVLVGHLVLTLPTILALVAAWVLVVGGIAALGLAALIGIGWWAAVAQSRSARAVS